MSAEKTIRWLHIIDILASSSSGLTLPELHQRIERDADYVQPVDLRTVQRDIREMDASGTVRFINSPGDGKAVRWALRPGLWGRSLSPLGASTLKLILRYMKGLLPLAALATLRTQEEQADRLLALGRMNKPGARTWEEKLRVIPAGHPLLAPNVPQHILENVYEALSDEVQIRARYRRPGSEEVTQRDYSVLALVVRPPKYQLLVRTDRDPYVLNMHRLVGVELLSKETDWPESFEIDEWIALGELGRRVGEAEDVVLRINRAMADHWSDMPLGSGQSITIEAESSVLRVSLVQTDELRRYLLSLGSQVAVIEPPSLKEWLRVEANAVVANHSETLAIRK